MKYIYIKPTMMVLELQQRCMLNGSDEVHDVGGNGGVGLGGSDAGTGAGTNVGRGRQARFSDWDEDWE